MAARFADPDTRFPGLPDGAAYDVAAVVEARTAGLWVLVEHLRANGCPNPNWPDLLSTVVADAEYAAWEADWPEDLRVAVVGACIDIEGLIERVREVTR
jgi:hypothetical protein